MDSTSISTTCAAPEAREALLQILLSDDELRAIGRTRKRTNACRTSSRADFLDDGEHDRDFRARLRFLTKIADALETILDRPVVMVSTGGFDVSFGAAMYYIAPDDEGRWLILWLSGNSETSIPTEVSADLEAMKALGAKGVARLFAKPILRRETMQLRLG